MTSQQFLVCDSSTLANFKQWAQAISSFFATAGWTQSTDTGQVNWTSIASVPGSNAYVYEVWKPGDALATFYAKIEYGNVGTNSPTLRITLCTTTNGAGTATGFILGPYIVASTAFTPPSTSTQYECDFSGSTSRIGAMLWRNGINSCQQMFAIERSVDSTGTYTGTHVTLFLCGNATQTAVQQTLHLTAGVTPVTGNVTPITARNNSGGYGFLARVFNQVQSAAAAFNGSIPFDLCAPLVGFFDYNLTIVGVGCATDYAEGVTFTATVYGSTRTYMVGKTGPFVTCANAAVGANGVALCMRYD